MRPEFLDPPKILERVIEMADPAVSFFLENLKQLLVYNFDLISAVKKQVESLCKNFEFMQGFLKDINEKWNEYECLRALARQIIDVTYEAEDIIDIYVVNAAMQKARSTMGKIVHVLDHPLTLRSIGKELEDIKAKVNEIYGNKMFGIEVLQTREPSKRGSSRRRAPDVETDNVVGFDEEAKTVIERLTKGPDQLEVISVVGMGGLGKTTLARKIYTDRCIQYHFNVHAWIYVSQEYNRKEVFLGILSSLVTKVPEQMFKMSADRLAEELSKHLKSGKFFIVIDDVWTKDAWDDLKMAFPNTNNGCRILLTSRNKEVASHASPNSPPHPLRFLTHDESWELLRTKVFQRGSCPSELEELGKQIAEKCHGLPLAIVVLAGLLSNKGDYEYWWKKVSESVGGYVANDPKQCMDVLALSYKHLPHNLKACFIYFGLFPEDFEIPVWKLLLLWVAEGFIQKQHMQQQSLEDIAEDYLEELVDRNLVQVEKRRLDGRIKTCRIHDMLRELCLREAAEEKFLQHIKVAEGFPYLTLNQNYHRRLCIHSRVLEYISSKPSGPHVRSFLCFAPPVGILPRQHTSIIFEAFKLLRVLDVRSIQFSKFPTKILVQLVHLRYIDLFGQFTILPEKISNLCNLQTLIVGTTSRSLDIQADIWKMLHLRHLYTSVSSCLRGPPAKTRKDNENPMIMRNIQTISTVSPYSCTENILGRTPNLKKLGIRGKLVALLDEKGGSCMFDNLTKLDCVQKLKLLNDTYPEPPSRVELLGLPQWYRFPPNLRKLTLSDTNIDWEHSSTLGNLPNLEVLKLKDNAFKGKEWKPLDDGFRRLKFLQIGRTDLVYWEASSHHFPRLQHVVLKQCEELKEIPSGLGDILELQCIELYHTSHSAAVSAKVIQQRVLNNGLKLHIYPPDLLA